MATSSRYRAVVFSLSVALGLLGSACSSMSGPGYASFASVRIENRSMAEVEATTQQVFGENGYVGGAPISGRMVFEKEGSRATTVAREGFMAAQSGARSIVRVRAQVVRLEGDAYRLQCEAFMVTGAGDSFFEEEHRLTNVRGAPYQRLLNEVARRLKQSETM
jgi:hypothetical protein